MARIRTIKPEFFVSAQIADVSPTCRLLFIGMWLFCDDAGIHPASARQLKMEVFPGDDITTADVQRMIDDLLRVGVLIEYESQGQSYWQVTGWHHQKIERPRYQYPQPDSTTPRRHVGDNSTTPRSLTVPETTVPETTRVRTSTRKRVGVYSESFERWWLAYPRKVGKGAGYRAYQSACKRTDAETLQAAVEEFAASDKAHGDWCPHASTWLNEDRWEDDRQEWTNRDGNGSAEPEMTTEEQVELSRKLLKEYDT